MEGGEGGREQETAAAAAAVCPTAQSPSGKGRGWNGEAPPLAQQRPLPREAGAWLGRENAEYAGRQGAWPPRRRARAVSVWRSAGRKWVG